VGAAGSGASPGAEVEYRTVWPSAQGVNSKMMEIKMMEIKMMNIEIR
jgi:hypothetical protein